MASSESELQRAVKTNVVDRRQFLIQGTKKGVGFSLLGLAAPSLLAACAADTATETASGASPGAPSPAGDGDATALVGDVLDFALTSPEWEGPFGFVVFRLHRAVVDGKDAFFIRTDASDQEFASQESLVWAPKIGGLARQGLSGEAYFFDDGDQPVVLSSEPGRPDYTPAWRANRVEWKGQPRSLSSVDDVKAAEVKGDLRVRPSKAIVNAAIVKWSGGEMPVDGELRDYLGGGQLIEAPDTNSLTVRFKLHECFPRVRYIVCDTSLEPMAQGMQVAHSPALQKSPSVEATGRTNVFMNGLKGPGPMGFQPSVFDSQAGAEEWSPYWDHMTYAWKKGKDPRVLTTEDEVHAARDAGELEEFPGTPDTKGTIFTVNCPVPVLAPNTFTG
ncbi:MAG: hypothetical protein M3277_05350 [Actinomycetota bacterium]|nr:hypothetical protein [Actinomycetota bacterium]